MERNQDNRSKKVAFVSSCLLNANNKVLGLSRYKGVCKEVLEVLMENDYGILQMPCPETLYLGVNRWWATKNVYACYCFTLHCNNLAKQMVNYMTGYEKAEYETPIILACDGSPSCGYNLTSFHKDWGGEPAELKFEKTLVKGMGVFIEQLTLEIEKEGIKKPTFYGLSLDDITTPYEKIIDDFKDFVSKI